MGSVVETDNEKDDNLEGFQGNQPGILLCRLCIQGVDCRPFSSFWKFQKDQSSLLSFFSWLFECMGSVFSSVEVRCVMNEQAIHSIHSQVNICGKYTMCTLYIYLQQSSRTYPSMKIWMDEGRDGCCAVVGSNRTCELKGAALKLRNMFTSRVTSVLVWLVCLLQHILLIFLFMFSVVHILM